MKEKVGRGTEREFPRQFVPPEADLGEPAVVDELISALERAEPSGARGLEEWLFQWSELWAALAEEEAERYILMTCQTDDPAREKIYLDFLDRVKPLVEERKPRLAEKFLSHPALSSLDARRHEVLIRDLKSELSLFRPENVPLLTQEQKLSQQYQKIVGAMTVEHEGREQTLQQMARYLELPNRPSRQAAWEKISARRLEDKDLLEELFDEMLALRSTIARNAGLPSYREYAFRLRKRFDYGVAECETFHSAVEKIAVPLYRRLEEERRCQLGLDRLRPWDLACDPQGRPPLRPFETADQLAAGAEVIFDRLHPELGEAFRFLRHHELLDLESRKGKAPGAYSHSLEERRIPFIFANMVGLDYDLKILFHEFGHSFHTLVSRHEPLVFYRATPLEFCEVASMSMEFLGLDHLDVFYSPGDWARSRQHRLEEVVWLFSWVATIDAFQHWIYSHPGHSRAERSQAWLSLLDRFAGIEDWAGYEASRESLWHRQLHIFEMPFYYIEYAIAELGALQVWRRFRQDKEAALQGYRAGLALGGCRPLPELFAASGIKFDFGPDALAPLVRMVEEELERAAA